MLYLRNLSSTEIFEGDATKIKVSYPEEIRLDKKERDEWINRPTTDHCVYSLWEGINPKLRVSSRKGSENPPAFCHGLAFDFDAPATQEERDFAIDCIPFPIYAIENTLTPGHWRLLVLFETPLPIPSVEAAKFFLKGILKTVKPGAGLDKPAFLEPCKYWTSSGDFEIRGDVMSANDVTSLHVKIFKEYKFKEFAESINLSIDQIQEQLEKQWPDFTRLWDGPFDFEAQGPTFWIPESSSPKSAIIKHNGIYTFSGHAPKSFYTWRELLGSEYVGKIEDDTFAEVAMNFARTDKNWYHKNVETSYWEGYEKADVVAELRCMGLSSKVDETGRSSVDRALDYIRHHRMVAGACPVVFNTNELVFIHEKVKVLNTYVNQKQVTQPSGEKEIWGPKGRFPWLSHYHDKFFLDDEETGAKSLDYYLAWLKRFYMGALAGKPMSGQAIFMVGGPGVGKTFGGSVIVPAMVGQAGDPLKYLLGKDNFGGELLECPVWAINDAGDINSSAQSKIYATKLKEIVANAQMDYHLKFKTPVKAVPFNGRVIGTCNNDSMSIRTIIPPTDLSNKDKVMVFRAPDRCNINFSDRETNVARVQKEIAHFCQWLIDWTPPAHVLIGDSDGERFGVKSYYDSVIMQKNRLTSQKHSLESCLRTFASENHSVQESYTTVDLFEAMGARFTLTLRSYTIYRFVQELEQITESPDENTCGFERVVDENEDYQWRITL